MPLCIHIIASSFNEIILIKLYRFLCRKLLYTVFLQSFDDLVAKKLPKENMKSKDKDGSDMGESVGPDYVVCIEYEYSRYSPQIWY